jgi:WD40 repeat protein/DNA-binding SARP family transcriptional activator/energy-coupling factor transporter ATP-binding protein EcfA2
MRFGVLGPLEVEADDGPVVVGGQKERLLLALLLTRPNRVVPVETLIRGLWGQHPPATAAKTLQSHVMRLRRALEPGRGRGAASEVLVTREPGYLLRVASGMLDAARFEELTGVARRALADGAAQTAATTLRQALDLWRGQAFEEFLDSDFGAAEAGRLAELRLVALEDRIQADLRLGRHRELVAELEGLVREQPLRERPWAQLLLVLYRSGRQADALLAYQRARSVLVEELGIDPGAELRRLQVAILAQDPGLDLPAMAGPGPAQQLPEALQQLGPAFVGRAAELAWLRAAWAKASHGQGGAVFLTGGQGMGKTRLAAELARQVHDQGGRVLYGRCTAAASDPLQPFAEALVGGGASVRDLPVPSIGQSGAGFGEQLAGLLAGWTDAVVLLVVDDLHLAQPPTLEALAALAAAAATRRLLVLGAHRQEVAIPALAALVEQLDPSGTGCRRLGPLDQDEVAQVLALYQSDQTALAAAGAVLEATGGVPLLVHQAAADRAQTQAANQVEETARQTASSRGQLRLVQARLADDVVDLQELREHSQQVARLATSQHPPGEEPEDWPAAVVCPYKGLARFEPTDAAFFFGRERLVAELVTHLVGAALVGVVGPSGSGKSSLVRAGLLPALTGGVLPGSDHWRQLLVRPGEHPMRELGLALGSDDGITAATGNGDGAAATSSDEGAGPVLGRASGNLVLEAAARAHQRLLLVVDQFEEVFTTCRDEAERARFLAALTEAAQAPDGNVTIVIGVRADYYGHCAAHPQLASLLAANHVLVGPMDPDELRRAIELPARRAGLHLESGLAEAMIAEVAEEPGGLPLLSCALLESWQHRRGRTLTLAAYQQVGGVRGAVARLAERAWRQLDADQQAIARRVLLRLAGPGEGEAVVRRRVPLSEFTQGPNQRARLVLDALADQRLLTKSHDTVEVAHETLLREWPRLRGWLEEDVQGRTLHRHLIGAAGEWASGGRDPEELYRGARLTGVLDWAREHDADLNQLEREFLDASRAAAEREVADARRRAEQEAQRARREAGISRRLRAALAGLVVVLVLALVAGGLALSLRGRAEQQALVADSRHLGAQALLEDELDRSLLLARQAVALDDSPETRSDLLAALLRSPAATAILRGNLEGIGPLELSPNEQLLAIGETGTLVLFDLRTRRVFPTKVHITGQVGDLRFSPNGSLLAFPTSELGPAYLLDVNSGRVLHDLSPLSTADTKYAVDGVEFSADGHTLTTLSDEGAENADFDMSRTDEFLTRWDVASGRPLVGPVRILSHHGGGFLLASPDHKHLIIVTRLEVLVYDAATFKRLQRFPHRLKQPQPSTTTAAAMDPHGDPHGRTLALGYGDGRLEFLDLATGRRQPTNGRHEGAVTSIRFSPDGKTLASGSFDRTVKLWDVASGQLRETLQGHEARVGALRFSDHGQTLYSAGSKSIIAWDLQGSHRLGRPFSILPGAPPALAVSPDGSLAATPDLHDADHVALRSITSPETVRRSLTPRLGPISAVAFSPDGKRLAVGGEHTPTPLVLDVASGAVVQKLTGGSPEGGAYPVSLRFDPTGRRLVAGLTGSPHIPRAIVWDTATGKPIANLPMPGPDDVAVAWSPDGKTVATAGGQGTVILWRAADWARIATLKVDPLAVLSVAFSPDSSVIAAQGLANRSITLLDVTTHKLVGRLPHPNIVHSVAFNPHGKTLATVDDNKVRLWDLASMRQIGPALPGPEQPVCPVPFCFNLVEFDHSGNHLIALYPSGTGIVWDVDPRLWEQRACAVAGRSLTREEWQELLPSRRYQPACQ